MNVSHYLNFFQLFLRALNKLQVIRKVGNSGGI